ncbi:MAG: SPOR domain-containing protein [Thioalkalivibrio sp.]|nr:SPOR domain-containing protein [Thioalkalivibrio sp.]
MTMEAPLRYRMVGAIVLIFVAVLVLPWVFDGAGYESMQGLEQPIPERPEFVAPQTPSAPVPVPMGQRAEQDRDGGEKRMAEPAPGPAPETQGPADAAPAASARSAGQAAAKPPTATEPVPDGVGWAVQVGSFGREENAREQAQRLRAEGFAAFVERASASGRGVWRVKVGPRAQRDEALRLRDEVQRRMDVSGIVIAHP